MRKVLVMAVLMAMASGAFAEEVMFAVDAAWAWGIDMPLNQDPEWQPLYPSYWNAQGEIILLATGLTKPGDRVSKCDISIFKWIYNKGR